MTIAEVAEKYDLSADTLRYYERIGLIPPIQRNKVGNRNYSETDCQWIQVVKCMRSAGITIESLIEYIRLFQQGEQTRQSRKEILQEQRNLLAQRIAELQGTLEKLDMKITGYDTVIFETEKKLLYPK